MSARTRVLAAAAAVVLAAGGLARAASRRALILGDSHLAHGGTMGDALDDAMRLRFEVARFSVCGSSIGWWLLSRGDRGVLRCRGTPPYYRDFGAEPRRKPTSRSAPELAELAGRAPDVVIVGLGSNPDESIRDSQHKAAEVLARLAPSALCFWIAPPRVPDSCGFTRGFSAAFEEMLRSQARTGGRTCVLVDSEKSASGSCHLEGEAAKAWGDDVAALILAAPGAR